jgi:myo-inositol-1(or 4)-monophosphatase
MQASRPDPMEPEGLPIKEAEEVLTRIQEGLEAAGRVLQKYTSGNIASRIKKGGSAVTEADLAVDKVLKNILPRGEEGWLSEETPDQPERLKQRRVWLVDPIDGTKEFISGIPEWCVSIGLVQDGEAVAGGIYNQATGQTIIGATSTGVRLNGNPVQASPARSLPGARVLASRSEVARGEWEEFSAAGISVQPTGSVAYKLALVAAGLAEATWTLTPKHEWDVVGGVALVRAAGGAARTLQWNDPVFNRKPPLLDGLIACGPGLIDEIADLLKPHLNPGRS